jgi:hypothetical protein
VWDERGGLIEQRFGSYFVSFFSFIATFFTLPFDQMKRQGRGQWGGGTDVGVADVGVAAGAVATGKNGKKGKKGENSRGKKKRTKR